MYGVARKVNCPWYRLLANAQVQAAAEEKKVTLKPKPEEIIDISPDTVEEKAGSQNLHRMGHRRRKFILNISAYCSKQGEICWKPFLWYIFY